MTPASSAIGQTLLEGAHEQPIGMTSCSLRLAGGTLQKQEKKKKDKQSSHWLMEGTASVWIG